MRFFNYYNIYLVRICVYNYCHVIHKYLKHGYINFFREVTSEKKITPYIHVLMNHVPFFVQKYGGLKPFQMDEVEQINHIHRKIFFRRTNHKKKIKRTITDQVIKK